jgi:hypothetical protein
MNASEAEKLRDQMPSETTAARQIGNLNSARLESLLDKLVAVQMDLEPICHASKKPAEVLASVGTVSDACEVLRSAIADVHNIILQTERLVEVTEKPQA